MVAPPSIGKDFSRPWLASRRHPSLGDLDLVEAKPTLDREWLDLADVLQDPGVGAGVDRTARVGLVPLRHRPTIDEARNGQRIPRGLDPRGFRRDDEELPAVVGLPFPRLD